MSARPDVDVEVVLDVRAWPQRLNTADEYAELWQQIEHAIANEVIAAGRTVALKRGRGEVRVEFARIVGGIDRLRPDTRVAIAAVREPADVIHACDECRRRGVERYGPFPCRECIAEGRPGRLCDDHVVILDGALLPVCAAHHPACAEPGCGAKATFRCSRCRGTGRAWCDVHRRPHPHELAVAYCPACFLAEFPPCAAAGCHRFATAVCEFTLDSADHPCGRLVCPMHARRWLVYGGKVPGLCLCPKHAATTHLDQHQTLFQIVAGTAWRQQGGRGIRPPRLPRLAGFADILRRSHPGTYPRRELLDALARLASSMQGDAAAPMSRLLEAQWNQWREEVVLYEEAQREGWRLVEHLRAQLAAAPGNGRLIADQLSLAEYLPAVSHRGALLFVNLPKDLRRHLIGARRARIGPLERKLGVRVEFEGDGRT